MGRAVYGGIYEPGHPTADADGWRHDVIDLVRRLGVSIVRYPGGNFVSGYDWEDGVGPRERRPTRSDLAWRSIEPNLVGTDDFIDWARLAGVEPMLAVNLGTRGAAAARASSSTQRRRPARPKATGGPPTAIATHMASEPGAWATRWTDPGRSGRRRAAEYGRRAAESAAAMRTRRPDDRARRLRQLRPVMPTFGSWERTVLDLTWEVIDHLSLHLYFDPAAFDSTEAYLDGARPLDRCPHDRGRDHRRGRGAEAERPTDRDQRRRVERLATSRTTWRERTRTVRSGARPRSPRTRPTSPTRWSSARLLLTLLRHADRVRIACVAQLVNVIPAIRTVDGGPAWLQPTAYPFADVATYARGTVLRVAPDGPRLDCPGGGRIDAVDMAATHDPDAGTLALFSINRASTPIRLEVEVDDDDLAMTGHTILHDLDPRATNTAEQPHRVVPRRGTLAPSDRRR